MQYDGVAVFIIEYGGSLAEYWLVFVAVGGLAFVLAIVGWIYKNR
jgi:hypothetical protein